MGGKASKPEQAFKPDIGQASFSGQYVQEQLKKASEQYGEAQASVATATKSAGWGWFSMKVFLGLSVIFGIILLYDYLAVNVFPSLPDIGLFTKTVSKGSGAPPETTLLFIDKATYANDNQSIDVTAFVQTMVTNDTTVPAFTVSHTALNLATDLTPSTTGADTLTVSYHMCGDPPNTYTATAVDGSVFDALPRPGDICKSQSAGGSSQYPDQVHSSKPGALSRAYNAIFGDSSGDLAPSFHDATTSAIIAGSNAPLSSESQGAYGMQWWMYIKDWNYGYGKKKSIVKRGDSTNGGIVNPDISLHPTDNALQISVSVFPATEGGSGKAEPAPAGHSGATDDVFTCDVTNIPLQTWFSVSVTVFGRNMDVYIDGKLVKSCFLTGVPKPTVGDIQLSPNGGFSGRICGFYHYPRMLTPGDAMNFWSAGTPCRSRTEPSTASKATGYSVKFGLYDVTGKEVQEYAF